MADNLTLSIDLPPEQCPSAKRLLGLPIELRNKIYHIALVSPPKYSRDHASDCHYRHKHTRTSIEPAACMVLDMNLELAEPFLYRGYPGILECRCAKRTALNLLLACRQVHYEAAPIFWSRNAFVFESSDEFTMCVGTRLREAYRPLLRSVYIASPEPWENARRTTEPLLTDEHVLQQPMSRWCEFWQVVFQCKGLRELAVRPEVIKRHAADLEKLARRLPQLRRFELTYIGRYKHTDMTREIFWENFRAQGKIQRYTTFVRASFPVPFHRRGGGAKAQRLDSKAGKELYRSFTTNFCVYINRIIADRFLLSEAGDLSRLEFDTMAPGLNDLAPSHTIILPTGQSARITFMGLPQSDQTRVAAARERAAREARLRALGKPTPDEEKVLEEIRSRKESKKAREAMDEQRDRDQVLEGRRLAEARRKEEETWERAKRRQEVARATEEDREARRLGRKRLVDKRGTGDEIEKKVDEGAREEEEEEVEEKEKRHVEVNPRRRDFKPRKDARASGREMRKKGKNERRKGEEMSLGEWEDFEDLGEDDW